MGKRRQPCEQVERPGRCRRCRDLGLHAAACNDSAAQRSGSRVSDAVLCGLLLLAVAREEGGGNQGGGGRGTTGTRTKARTSTGWTCNGSGGAQRCCSTRGGIRALRSERRQSAIPDCGRARDICAKDDPDADALGWPSLFRLVGWWLVSQSRSEPARVRGGRCGRP